ncbi:glycerate kinase, partial [Sinorhizobium meliloti]
MAAIANPRQFLESLFASAVSAADPERVIAANLPERPKGR